MLKMTHGAQKCLKTLNLMRLASCIELMLRMKKSLNKNMPTKKYYTEKSTFCLQVTNSNSGVDQADGRDFDHTWNQDGHEQDWDEQDNTTVSADESLAAKQRSERPEIMEEDVEIFLENEMQSAKQDTSALSDEMRPVKGMQFKSREEAQQFLNMYSFAAGFSIAVASVYRTTSK